MALKPAGTEQSASRTQACASHRLQLPFVLLSRHSAGSVDTAHFANTEREKDTTEDSDSEEPRGGSRRQQREGGTSMSTAARRTAELQEKNRNAQRRWVAAHVVGFVQLSVSQRQYKG